MPLTILQSHNKYIKQHELAHEQTRGSMPQYTEHGNKPIDIIRQSMTEEARKQNRGKACLINSTGKIGQQHAKESSWTTISHQYTKIKSNWIKELNIRPETIKLLEESIGSMLFDSGHHNFTLFLWFVYSTKENKSKKTETNGTKTNSKGLTQQGKPLTDKKGNLLKGRRYLQRLYKLRD